MKAVIVGGKSISMRRRRGISICEYQLRVGADDDRLKGRNHEGRVLCSTTSGHGGPPAWLKRLADMINNSGRFEIIVAAVVADRFGDADALAKLVRIAKGREALG